MLSCDKLFRAALEKDYPYVVGLDISLTSTGVYLMSLKPDESHPDFHYHITTTSKNTADTSRIDSVVDTIVADLSNPQYPVIAACIEDYGPVGRFAGKILVRAELVGIVKRSLRNGLRIPYMTVSPNGLIKAATGYGRVPRGYNGKQLKILAAQRFGFTTKNDDEADAFHAARLCAAFVRGEKLSVDFRRTNPRDFTFLDKAAQFA